MGFIPQWQEAQRHVHASASLGCQKRKAHCYCNVPARPGMGRQRHHLGSLFLVTFFSHSAPPPPPSTASLQEVKWHHNKTKDSQT